LNPPILSPVPVPYVPKRVHIAAVGFEVDREAEPIIQMRGELAILFANAGGEDLARAFRDQVLDRLRRAHIQASVVRTPIFDLYATTQAILHAIRDHREDRVYVNVSSGSKVQALSGYIATSLARSEGLIAEAYYAEPQSYSPTEGEPLSRGFQSAFVVPSLTLQTPTGPCRSAMESLEAGPLSKVELALRLAKLGILDASRLDASGHPRDDASRVSLQSSLDSKVVRPLAAWGFVVTTPIGRSVRVSLTEAGRLALRLYKLESPTAH
jgi:hypothetical protein